MVLLKDYSVNSEHVSPGWNQGWRVCGDEMLVFVHFLGYTCASLHVHMRARVLCVRTGVSARINRDSITIMGIMPITFVVPIMFIMFTFFDKYPH